MLSTRLGSLADSRLTARLRGGGCFTTHYTILYIDDMCTGVRPLTGKTDVHSRTRTHSPKALTQSTLPTMSKTTQQHYSHPSEVVIRSYAMDIMINKMVAANNKIL